jgi:hypothetical protein
MIGYKFMGKAHSNTYLRAPFFFELPVRPEMTVICGREEAGVAAAASRYGWQSYETSWEKLDAVSPAVTFLQGLLLREKPGPMTRA